MGDRVYKSLLFVVIGCALSAGSFGQTNTFPSSGNVGIGTTNPASPLDVRSNSGSISSLYGTTGGNQAVEIGNSVTHMNLGVGGTGPTAGVPYIWSASGNFFVGNDGEPSVFVQGMGSGNVGIGTTNTNGHKLMVRDAGTNGVVWSMAVNNPVNVQGSSLPAVGIKLSLSTEESGSNESDKWDGLLAYTEPGAEYGNSMGLAIYTNQGAGGGQAPTEKMRITAGGNVGIGTTAPGAKLEVNGNIKLTANSGASIMFPDGTTQSTAWSGTLCGGDYAESVKPAGGKASYEPGDVLVISEGTAGDVAKSTEPYSTLVAGIYSTKPGIVGRRQTGEGRDAEIPMAMVGIVPTKVSAENGPIRKGDLLVTSSTPGYAMKGTDPSRMLGAIVGKALGSLDSGTGVIEVLVSLQ